MAMTPEEKARWQRDKERKEFRDARYGLATASIVLGPLMALLSYAISGELLLSVVVGAATPFVWPLIGAAIIDLHRALRKWAFEGETMEVISKAHLVMLAAAWPVTLFYALVVYPCVGIVRRQFPDDGGN